MLTDLMVRIILTSTGTFYATNNEAFNDNIKSMATSDKGSKVAFTEAIAMLHENLLRDILIVIIFSIAGAIVAYNQYMSGDISAAVLIVSLIVIAVYLLVNRTMLMMYAAADYLFCMLKMMSYEKQNSLENKADRRNIDKMFKELGVEIHEK